MSQLQSREHTCFSQHLGEEKPKRCRCRKKHSLAEATKIVEKGQAQWLVTSQTTIKVKETCQICVNDVLKKGCQNCQGTGEVEKEYTNYAYGTDIVLVTTGSLNDDGLMVYRPVKAKKTPRVATIEKAHIERAYLDSDREEQERIEIYGLMTLEARTEMGIKAEPEDDLKTGSGRRYDYGRSPFARISDERTSIGTVGSRITNGFVFGDESKTGESLKEKE